MKKYLKNAIKLNRYDRKIMYEIEIRNLNRPD